MKFVYGYKTKENETRSGEIIAASRDSAYRALKEQGIRPFKVELAPGFTNGLVALASRSWKYWLLVVIVLALFVVALVQWRSSRSVAAVIGSIDSSMRRQPIGDSAIIEMGVRVGWRDVFSNPGERYLASFAIPGRAAAVCEASPEEVESSLENQIEVDVKDSIEERQLKAMVNGMKTELRNYLAAGGTVAQYMKRLVSRQETEIGYYQSAKEEIEKLSRSGVSREEVVIFWENRNSELRKMGIMLIPFPENLGKRGRL